MPTFWHPDTCPPGGPCFIEVTEGAADIIRFVLPCPLHDGLRVGGMTDAAVFAQIKSKNQIRNRAVALIAEDLALEEGTPLATTVDSLEVIHIRTGRVNGLERARLQTLMDTQLGVGAVVVETL